MENKETQPVVRVETAYHKSGQNIDLYFDLYTDYATPETLSLLTEENFPVVEKSSLITTFAVSPYLWVMVMTNAATNEKYGLPFPAQKNA